jgi:hypothetical protein
MLSAQQTQGLSAVYEDDLVMFNYPDGWVTERAPQLEVDMQRVYITAASPAILEQYQQNQITTADLLFIIIEPIETGYGQGTTLETIAENFVFGDSRVSEIEINGVATRVIENPLEEFAVVVTLRSLGTENYVIYIDAPVSDFSAEGRLRVIRNIIGSFKPAPMTAYNAKLSNTELLLNDAQQAVLRDNIDLAQALLLGADFLIDDMMIAFCEQLSAAKETIQLAANSESDRLTDVISVAQLQVATCLADENVAANQS